MNLIEESNKKYMEADASSVDDIIRLLDNYTCLLYTCPSPRDRG